MTDPSAYSGKFIKVSEVKDAGGVLIVQLARSPVNAVHEEMWRELSSIFDKISRDGEVRAVVLGSNIPNFWCAGLDLVEATKTISKPPSGQDAAREGIPLRQHILDFQNAISSIENCRQPVIAAVHGLAIGLSVDILCTCDIRYAASDTKFSIKEVDVGMAADIGTLARFPKIVGNQSAARELALTARMFDANEAKDIGFVNKVVQGSLDEVMKAAVATAKLIASKSPMGTVGTKHILLHARDNSVRDNLEYTATWNALALQSADSRDAFAAFTTKKPPVYKPLPKL
ncbi:hypothetical protein FRC02_002749 [Tulasnella sp. 418]|nr:hypothetical protein FRC02_002749 [Tulasnella sp. 418]